MCCLRMAPADARHEPVEKKERPRGPDKYVLHVVGGQTIDPEDEEDGTDVLATTEVLQFDRIRVVPKWPFDYPSYRP